MNIPPIFLRLSNAGATAGRIILAVVAYVLPFLVAIAFMEASRPLLPGAPVLRICLATLVTMALLLLLQKYALGPFGYLKKKQ